jgi:hypothetical protein
MSNKVTQNQFTTQGQSFEANLASLEAMIEQLLNGDRVSNKGAKLLWIFQKLVET